jgi:hypothetical protein
MEVAIEKEIEQHHIRTEPKKTELEDVYNVFKKWLHITDWQRIDVVLATVLSNQLPGTPIWLLLIAPSGDWKSTLVNALNGLSSVIKLDQITKNTLASGMQGVDFGSTLQNSSHIFLFPDLASLISKNVEEKNEIWGQLRNLYDGFINKRTGNNIERKYEGCHITLIACTTPVIENEILVHQQLGTRELMYKTTTDPEDDDKKMDMASMNEEYEEDMSKELKEVVVDFICSHPIKEIIISKEIMDFMKKEAKRLSILRSGTARDKNYELLSRVEKETPTRTLKQFKRLYISLKSLYEGYPDERAKGIISHIVNSSGDITRQRILDLLVKTKKFMKISEVSLEIRLSRNKIKGELETLWNMGIIEKTEKEERIGGYETEYNGELTTRGGRVEMVAYYGCF